MAAIKRQLFSRIALDACYHHEYVGAVSAVSHLALGAVMIRGINCLKFSNQISNLLVCILLAFILLLTPGIVE